MGASKSERVKRLIDYYSDGNKRRFADKLGVSPQLINTWISRDTLNYDLIFAKCEYLSPLWLLSGEGAMITSGDEYIIAPQDNTSKGDRENIHIIIEQAEEIGRLKERAEALEREVANLRIELVQRRSGNSVGDVACEPSALVG
jgi:bacteriophage CI repressor helix-turn-helix domain